MTRQNLRQYSTAEGHVSVVLASHNPDYVSHGQKTKLGKCV